MTLKYQFCLPTMEISGCHRFCASFMMSLCSDVLRAASDVDLDEQTEMTHM